MRQFAVPGLNQIAKAKRALKALDITFTLSSVTPGYISLVLSNVYITEFMSATSAQHVILPPHVCETVHDADTTRKLWGD